jgi:hypothetical protein
MADSVQLTDLDVIARYSIAVRTACADRDELIETLRADLEWLERNFRQPRPAPVAPPGAGDAGVGDAGIADAGVADEYEPEPLRASQSEPASTATQAVPLEEPATSAPGRPAAKRAAKKAGAGRKPATPRRSRSV